MLDSFFLSADPPSFLLELLFGLALLEFELGSAFGFMLCKMRLHLSRLYTPVAIFIRTSSRSFW